MPADPREEIKPGDWVVWSDFHNDQSDEFRRQLGPGPFKVQALGQYGLYLVGTKFSVTGGNGVLYGPRFRKDTFITAVKEALKDATP